MRFRMVSQKYRYQFHFLFSFCMVTCYAATHLSPLIIYCTISLTSHRDAYYIMTWPPHLSRTHYDGHAAVAELFHFGFSSSHTTPPDDGPDTIPYDMIIYLPPACLAYHPLSSFPLPHQIPLMPHLTLISAIQKTTHLSSVFLSIMMNRIHRNQKRTMNLAKITHIRYI